MSYVPNNVLVFCLCPKQCACVLSMSQTVCLCPVCVPNNVFVFCLCSQTMCLCHVLSPKQCASICAGIYGAWTTIATLLNVGSALAYKCDPPLSQSTTSLLCLGILAAVSVIFVVLDLTVLETYSRFTYSPYALLLWALTAILSKNWNPEQASSIFVAVLTGLGVVGLVLKLVVSFWRQKQQPRAYRSLKVWSVPGNDIYPTLSIK